MTAVINVPACPASREDYEAPNLMLADDSDHALIGNVESQAALPSSSTCPLGQLAPGRTICQI